MPGAQTQLCRHATSGAGATTGSGVSQVYAMAGPLFSKPIIWATRAAPRAAFGARQCAGLSMTSIILWDELKRT